MNYELSILVNRMYSRCIFCHILIFIFHVIREVNFVLLYIYICDVCVCVIFLQEVGCDFGINSNAKEDSCGVCLGDGSTCETVKENFVAQDGVGV